MLIRFAVRRIARHWHLLVIPLLGACLASGLFALAPLYSRAVSELGLRYAMQIESHQRVNVRAVSSLPLDETVFAQVEQTLGDLFRYKADVAESTRLNEYDIHGRPPQFRKEGWLFYSASELDQHATPTAGRWPRDRVPYFVPCLGGLRADAGLEPDERFVVHRAAADVEAVGTETVLRRMGIDYPQHTRIIHFGPGLWDLRVRVVGVIAANDADEAYWMGQSQPLEGTTITGPDGEPLLFGSLFVTRPAMERLIDGIEQEPDLKDDLSAMRDPAQAGPALRRWTNQLRQPVSSEVADRVYVEAQKSGLIFTQQEAGVTYAWYIVLNRDAITASTMRDSAQNVLRVGEVVTSRMPTAQVISSLVSIIRVYLDQVRDVQAPVTFLTGGVLVLVLYYVLTTTSLVLEQQATEWATVTSRGGSNLQLLFVHGVTVLFQCLIAFASSLPLSQALLFVLRRSGPLARLAIGPTLPIKSPPETWDYAAIASLVAAVALLLPAIPTVRRTIVVLQQAVARPPRRPRWARFFLDVFLLAIGGGLLLRARQLGNLRAATFTGQMALDAMTVVAPLLLMTGGALLWLRLFPMVMRLLGGVASRARGLALPLGFWGVGRNPEYYAQLVLLLLGAFGLGAMSSALSATRDSAAWRQAQTDTGGTVRVELAEKADPDGAQWEALPGVTAASAVFRGVNSEQRTATTLQLIGIDPQTLPAVAPLDAQTAQFLADQEAAPAGGIALPEGVVGLSMWTHHAVEHEDSQLTLWIILSDRWGFVVPLEAEGDPLSKDRWVRWEGRIPTGQGRPPWRLAGLAFSSVRGTASFSSGQLLVDDIVALMADASQVTVESFETESLTWSSARDQDGLNGTVVERIQLQAHSGSASVSLGYRTLETARYGSQPYGVWTNRAPDELIPVLVERRYADQMRLKMGDPLRIEVTLAAPYTIRAQRVLCQVMGVLDTFPTLGEAPNPFVVAPLRRLLPAINAGARDWPLEPNEIWLGTGSFALQPALLDRLGDPRLAVEAVHTAFERREALRRQPLINAFAGILFGGFWVALALSLVGFGFYLTLTVRRREVSFAVLRSLGWSGRDVWRLLVVEQVALVTPAVLVGIALGVVLADAVRRFIPILAGAALEFPTKDVLIMIIGLIVGLALLLAGAGYWIQRRELARTLRLGGE